MNTRIHESVRDEKGFTLVELAIVMVIIGLLIGGILKGQEMIANAQVTATVAQIKGIDAATSTFRDQYDAFPGDMRNASTRLIDCATDPCNDGDGDSRININVGAAGDVDDEGAFFFNQLKAAELISGFDGSAVYNFGAALPSASMGGGYMIGHAVTGTTLFTAGLLRPSHYLVLTGAAIDVTTTSGIATASQASRIDRKIDDGNSQTGSVVSQTACENGGVYDEIDVDLLCNIAIRIQG
ncbi:MAG: hypothetical protein COB36_01195 [Alphaproteobacteria bacterium]|nr:MAG: hypothetical protein COB36_01195 [Alphaproteobacteria bacterium]